MKKVKPFKKMTQEQKLIEHFFLLRSLIIIYCDTRLHTDYVEVGLVSDLEGLNLLNFGFQIDEGEYFQKGSDYISDLKALIQSCYENSRAKILANCVVSEDKMPPEKCYFLKRLLFY